MTVFVPSSPEKVARVINNLQQGYERQRHAVLYGSASSSIAAPTSTTIRESALVSQKSSFLASSAIAHRSAGSVQSRSSKPSQIKTFKRNAESDLKKTAAVAPTIGQQRDDSLRLIETLPIGPKEMDPPEDDPHFLKYEPTSGIALRLRKMPHQEMFSHLEGRYYIPISTLYSIAVPGRCDDGDFSIPVEGNWVTMGVVVKRSEVLFTKPIGIDHLGRRLNKDGIPIDDIDNPFMTPEEKKEISRKNQGAGQMKELESKKFIVFTLLDIGNQPDKFGQHDGSCEIELALFAADTSVIDSDGQRKYFGGSNGAYEKLLMATYGTLVCILNPKVRKGYKGKGATKKDDPKSKDDDAREKGPTSMRLNARSAKSVAIVGVAKNYGQCQDDRCFTFVDRRMKTSLCDYHMGSRLEYTQNGRPQLQSSWRKSTFGNQYSATEGMSGPKTKQYVFDSAFEEDPTLPGGKLYDVSTDLGRGNEMRAEDRRRAKFAEENQARQDLSQFRNDLSEVKLKEKALAKMKVTKQEQSSRQGAGRNILNSVVFDSAGSKVIEASQKAVLERKRQAEVDSSSTRKGIKKSARRGIQENMAAADTSIPAGSYRSSNGDVKVLSDISSKLLSRHSVKASELSSKSPLLLGRKRAKLPPAVRPPPGESFYADESSDEEFNDLMQSDAMNEHLLQMDKAQCLKRKLLPVSGTVNSDSDSDLEIIHS